MDSSYKVLDGVVIQERYQLVKLIGQGSFGQVYLANDTIKNKKKQLAVKIEWANPVQRLKQEAHIIDSLQGCFGVPKLLSAGYVRSQGFHYMMSQMLGLTLEDIFNSCGRQFTLKTTCMLMHQMLAILQGVHERGFVHRDIKPENFLLGFKRKSNKLFAIDFGLSKAYTAGGKHKPMKKKDMVVGTPRFASHNGHRGASLSRRDDLESIGLVWISLLLGSLPWDKTECQDQKLFREIGHFKELPQIEKLCAQLPQQVLEYMRYCHGLSHEATPDYNHLKLILN